MVLTQNKTKPNPCNERESTPGATSEDAGRQLLAEHAVKVQLSAHQVLLYVLQRPLVIGQLQRLPLSLKSQGAR